MDSASGRPFLTARWSNLLLASYVAPDYLLRRHLPPGLELDRRDGHTYVSLVAFDFLDTRVLGVRWPGLADFPEVHLRFYVRSGAERGVVFVRELVPSRLVAAAARRLYNEPYRATPMGRSVRHDDGRIAVTHRFAWEGRLHRFSAVASEPPCAASANGAENFFKEHQWGFGVDRRGRTTRYEVRHPVWEIYPNAAAAVDVDFGSVYGPSWSFLTGSAPASVVLAVGSPVAVFRGRRLE